MYIHTAHTKNTVYIYMSYFYFEVKIWLRQKNICRLL